MSYITDIPVREDIESLRQERDQLRDEVQRLKVSYQILNFAFFYFQIYNVTQGYKYIVVKKVYTVVILSSLKFQMFK